MFPVNLFHYWRYGKVSCSKSNLKKIKIQLKISNERLQTKVIISEIDPSCFLAKWEKFCYWNSLPEATQNFLQQSHKSTADWIDTQYNFSSYNKLFLTLSKQFYHSTVIMDDYTIIQYVITLRIVRMDFIHCKNVYLQKDGHQIFVNWNIGHSEDLQWVVWNGVNSTWALDNRQK